MPLTISVAMLQRMVSERSKAPEDLIAIVLEAHAEVVRGLLKTGAKVRFLDGWLVEKERAATRRKAPTGEWFELPAKRQVSYVESPFSVPPPKSKRLRKK